MCYHWNCQNKTRLGVKTSSLFYKSRCIQLQVSDEAYCRIRDRIQNIAEHRTEYRYTRLGVLFCALRLSFHWKDHYFCSQFVAELLSEGSEVQILLSTVGIGMISRNCEIIPICLCNGKKSLRFTLGIANEIGIRIMKISQQKSTYFQNRKMNSSKKLWRRCCFRQYG